MNRHLFLILICVCLLGSNFKLLQAQEKFERESRLKVKDVPAQALQFMESLEVEQKVKWYFEEDLKQNSIEAKYKKKRTRYSVEFDTLGHIEDIEIEVAWNELEGPLQYTIQKQLSQNCSKYKIRKIQVQYAGNEANLIAQVKSAKASADVVIKYEIVVKCKSEKSVDLFEYLFSATGQLIRTYKINFNNSSHLEY